MKPSVLLLFPLLFLVACHSNDRAAATPPDSPQAATAVADSNWLPAFRAFRDAVYRHDVAAARAFVQLPMDTLNNEVFVAIAPEGGELAGVEAARPFVSRDFDTYFEQLFPPRFVKALLRVKSEALYHNGHAESPLLKEGGARFRLYADADSSRRELTLNFYTETPVTAEDNSEYSILYIFGIRGNTIVLQRVRVAG